MLFPYLLTWAHVGTRVHTGDSGLQRTGLAVLLWFAGFLYFLPYYAWRTMVLGYVIGRRVLDDGWQSQLTSVIITDTLNGQPTYP